MRTSAATIAGALVLAGALAGNTLAAGHEASGAGGRTHASRCRAPAHAKVLVRNRRLLMWRSSRTLPDPNSSDPGETLERYAACVPPQGRPDLLARVGHGGTPQCGSEARLASGGSFVAILAISGCSSGWYEELSVEDVLHGTGRKIIYFGASTGSSPELPPSLTALGPPFGIGVQRLAVDARGDVAWLAHTEAESGRRESAADVLYLADRAGTRRVAVAPSIGRIRFDGSQLSWRAGGSAHSTPG